ncbi:MAG: phosphotransferase [Kineosporiaceae bacterium]|jgi:hypothetical protein
MSEDLDRLIDEHVAAVDRRARGGPYDSEAQEVRTAAKALSELWRRLELREPGESPAPRSGKPQLLLTGRSARHGDIVLKVYGRQRPHEAAIQGWWHRRGVKTVAVVDHGDVPVSWLLMTRAKGAQPDAVDATNLTAQLAAIMNHVHGLEDPPPVPPPFRLAAGVEHHLASVLRVAETHGYHLPNGWRTIAGDLYRCGPVSVLHGDLTVRNLLRSDNGTLLLLDTCGYTGPPEFDAARWCARLGGSDNGEALLNVWLSSEGTLNVPLARRFLGLELLMEAGVREIVKSEGGVDWSTRDSRTAKSIDLGWALVS